MSNHTNIILISIPISGFFNHTDTDIRISFHKNTDTDIKILIIVIPITLIQFDTRYRFFFWHISGTGIWYLWNTTYIPLWGLWYHKQMQITWIFLMQLAFEQEGMYTIWRSRKDISCFMTAQTNQKFSLFKEKIYLMIPSFQLHSSIQG